MQGDTGRKYANRIELPGIRKIVKMYLLKTSSCQSFSVLLGVGVECGWGSSAMGLEFEFNILVFQSSYVVLKCPPTRTESVVSLSVPTTI
jgi:hypothetical protein